MNSFKTVDRITRFLSIMPLDDIKGNFNKGDFINYLIEKGFFKSPASRGFHGAFEGGLFEHSYQVTRALEKFTALLGLEWERKESPYIVGMFHDLCKMELYVQNDDSAGFHYNSELILNGHGEKSIILLQQHILLTEEEIMCIRWHMGAFDDSKNWEYYSRAVSAYPNVLYTHTADMIASKLQKI